MKGNFVNSVKRILQIVAMTKNGTYYAMKGSETFRLIPLYWAMVPVPQQKGHAGDRRSGR
jgi:hypothetical protein